MLCYRHLLDGTVVLLWALDWEDDVNEPSRLAWTPNVKSKAVLAMLVAAALCASACHHGQSTADDAEKSVGGEKAVVAEKPFVAGGTIEMQLDGGEYQIRPGADNHIRVTLSGSTGNTKVEVTASGTNADVRVKDTPHSNFKATIEVPNAADLVVHLAAGSLSVAAIAGNKDVESTAGEVKIAVGDPDDYSSVDASVKVGDIDAGGFGGSKSGFGQHFTWSGHGKYTLRASVGAGNLVLQGK
jgi:hypothetical protein